MAVLQRFGYDVEKVKGPKVHSLYNVMTMQKDAHDAFNRLEMWFESTVGATLRNYAGPNAASQPRGLRITTAYKPPVESPMYLAK